MWGVCSWLFLLAGCGLLDDVRSKVAEVSGRTAADPAKVTMPVVDGTALVEAWHQATNSKDITAYGSMLGDPMIYYTKTMSAVEASGRKSRSLNKVPDFRQSTVGVVRQQMVGADEVWLRFTKQVRFSGKQKEFETVLVYGRMPDGKWKLIKESDGPTERVRTKKNLARLKKAKRTEQLLIDVDGDGVLETVGIAVVRKRRGERRSEQGIVVIQDGEDASFGHEYSGWGDRFWKTGMVLEDGQELVGWSRAPMNGTCWEHTLQRWGVQGFRQVLSSERCGHDSGRATEFMIVDGEIHQLDSAGEDYVSTSIAVR